MGKEPKYINFTNGSRFQVSTATAQKLRGSSVGRPFQMYDYQEEILDLVKMKNDLCYFAEKHRAPLVPTPAQLYMMKAIMEQYEKTGEVKVMVRKR